MIFYPHVPEGVKASLQTSSDGKSIDLFIDEIPILSIGIGADHIEHGNIVRFLLTDREIVELRSKGFKIEGKDGSYRVSNLEFH